MTLLQTRGEVVGGDSVAAYAALSLSPDGRRIAVAAENLDSATRVWDWTSGQCVAELAKARIRAVSFSPDGLQLLTGSADNTARIWDLTSRQCLPTAKVGKGEGEGEGRWKGTKVGEGKCEGECERAERGACGA